MAEDLNQTFTLLVHGLAKVGKSLLGASVTKPLLYLDGEFSAQHLPMRRITIKPHDPFPTPSDDWDVCVISIKEWAEAKTVLERLQTQKHPFRGITVDSIGALQKRLIAKVAGVAAVDREQWGEILREMENFCEGLKDLTRHPRYPVLGVCVLCPTRRLITGDERNPKENWVPYLRGQMGDIIPYIFDVTGYLFVENIYDKRVNKMVETRLLRTRRTTSIEAGERVNGKIAELYKVAAITGSREEVVKKNLTFERLRAAVYRDEQVAIAAPATSAPPPPEPPAPAGVTKSTAEGA